MTKETHLRSVVKGISWRIGGSLVTLIIAFLITHEVQAALTIGFFEFIAKVIGFYIHERVWLKIKWGYLN